LYKNRANEGIEQSKISRKGRSKERIKERKRNKEEDIRNKTSIVVGTLRKNKANTT
jgi:hypothetical protein